MCPFLLDRSKHTLNCRLKALFKFRSCHEPRNSISEKFELNCCKENWQFFQLGLEYSCQRILGGCILSKKPEVILAL